MKKILLIMLWFILPVYAKAQGLQVTYEEAERVAVARLGSEFPMQCLKMESIETARNEHGNVLIYDVMLSCGKSVLVSGCKACLPILGVYESQTGSALAQFTTLPCGLQFLIEYYKERIDSCFRFQETTELFERDWRNLLAGITPKGNCEPVKPLTRSKWTQKAPNVGDTSVHAYNHMIRSGDDCEHCLVGCVAVAMGQIMYYWQYPVLGYNRMQQFDWCNMTETLNVGWSSYEIHRDAIAYLLSECGKSVDMEYGCGTSSASIGDAIDAFEDEYFFHEDADRKRRLWHCDGDWIEMIRDDLKMGWPVYYRGMNSFWFKQGHAFVCDGYDEHGNFHFNWGWGQANPAHEGYFTLDSLCPRKDRNYQYWQEAIFHLRPQYSQDICDVHLNLGDFYPTLPVGYQSQLAYLFSPKTMTTLTSASISSPAEWRTIPAGGVAEYVAHEEVILEDGFEAEWGSEFEARIEPCAKCDGTRGEALAQPLDNIADQPSDSAAEYRYVTAAPDIQLPQVELFPNPTDGPLTVETDGMATAIVVYDLMGRPVGGWRLDALTKTHATLDVSSLRPGAYLLAVQTETGTKTARFVRK